MEHINNIPAPVLSLCNISSIDSNLSLNRYINCLRLIDNGTIIIRFRNYPKQGFMPLLSVANSQYPCSYLSIYIEHAQKIGVYKHLINKDKITTKHLDLHKTTVVDPKFINTIALSCKKNYGYTLFFNGEEICFLKDNHANLFADINQRGEIDKAILGDFYEGQKITDKHYTFAGHYDFVNIYDSALNHSYLCQITGQTMHDSSIYSSAHNNSTPLFYPGLNGSSNFRIPTLFKTSNNTLLSSVDQREFGHQDHSNKIKTIIRRSQDNGNSFDEPITACEMFGNGQTIDSALAEDCVNKRIFLLNNSHPDCMKPFSPMPGTGFVMHDDKVYYNLSSSKSQYYGSMEGDIFDACWNNTQYSFDDKYDLYKKNVRLGNLFDSDCPIKAYQTTYTLICHSDDDGETWSKPKILNPMIKEEYMKSLNVSPGIGIQIKNGKYKNRLCFPVYYYNQKGAASSAIIYSDDFGETFTLGKSPNDGRLFEGRTLSSNTIKHNNEFLTECQIVEMPNGYIKLFMRNMNGYIAIATSRDGGESFDSNVLIDTALPDSYCQCSVISLNTKIDSKDTIAFCNPSDTARTSGKIKIGLLDYCEQEDDYNITWKYSKMIKQGSFAYSCMSQIDKDTIGLVYEGTPSTILSFAKVNLDYTKTPDTNPYVKFSTYTANGNLVLTFNETVMLTSEEKLNISGDFGTIESKLNDRNIQDNSYTFPLDKSINNEDITIKLSENTQLYNISGERIFLSMQ